ncbi:histidinol-phosphatase [Spirochaeta isovalerica]|uniref:Histidinol-phosphatase n=1 Tax=Spirochaeta isovalerica TaxID=150 RepID=A0A841REY5_9SPIO|nr:histidinol-phosphatase [Spirochaeta isovalerica]MBB6482553.1 histidinol-phosphatase (PHP family) [Spirochaeta isovalerica]
MIQSNFHTHCDYCDGSGKPEDVVEEALARNFDILGFSSHAPIASEPEWTISEADLPVYLKHIDELKAEYAGKLEIWKGLEIDYIEGVSGPSSEKFLKLNLDYAIGSVHMIKSLEIHKFLAVDGPEAHLIELIEDVYGGSMERVSDKYYSLICEMAEKGGFDILGHLDLIKKRNRDNRYFNEDEPWYRKQVLNTLDYLKERDIVVEVNTGGISRGATDSVYPSPWIIREASVRKIPLMLNADSHVPEHIDFYFNEALQIISECGYKELHTLQGSGWTSFPIEI